MPRRRADSRRIDRARQGFTAGSFKTTCCPEASEACARPASGPRNPLQRTAWRAGAADRLDEPDDRLLAEQIRSTRRSSEKDGPMTAMAETRSGVVERG